jgi:hypothetical protein
MTARLPAVLAGALLILGATSVAIGESTPTILRVVTMDGASSMAYYSVIERRYIFLDRASLQASADLKAEAPAETVGSIGEGPAAQ